MPNNNNPNRQDTTLGGMILAGFVVIAVLAALFALIPPRRGDRSADVPKAALGSDSRVRSTHGILYKLNDFGPAPYLRSAIALSDHQ